MPTYSYLCDACGSEFEKEQRISEAPTKKCPSCGKLKARRMITGGNFILKGGGWYSDGYGSSKSSGSGAKPNTKAPEAAKDAKDTSSATPSTTSSTDKSSSSSSSSSSTPASSSDD